MPQQREAPVSKKARGGQLAIATKMAVKAKLVVKHLKLKELMAVHRELPTVAE